MSMAAHNPVQSAKYCQNPSAARAECNPVLISETTHIRLPTHTMNRVIPHA